METAIEILALLLAESKNDDIVVSDVLVPEQCMTIYMNGKVYHVTIEEIEPC